MHCSAQKFLTSRVSKLTVSERGQGFFIFVAFILRPKVLQYIKKTALQSLSRSFGHDSQQDGHQHHPRGGGEAGAAARAAQAGPSPITLSTRVNSSR